MFLFFLFLFLLISPAAVLYSQGYRLDFENKKLVQTGGFFLKAEPKQVEVYVEGKLVKKTDFLFGSVLIENLLPKNHKIEIRKENYLSWEKNLEITEREVTEVKNLVLFQKNLNFNVLTKNSENFWFSADGKKIVLLEEDNYFSLNQISQNEHLSTEEKGGKWSLKLYDLEKNIKSNLISETEFFQEGAIFLNLEFSENSKEIYLNVETEKKLKTFILELDKLPLQLVEKKEIPLPENIIASKKHNQDVYRLNNSGYFLKNDSVASEMPFKVKPETEYSIEIFQNFIFLRENRNFYLFSSDLNSFEDFFIGINELKISPDGKKLVFFSNSEIWILFLRDDGRKKAGEKLFLVRLSEKIKDVFWLNSDYLIFNSGKNLKIVETDERDRIQTWILSPIPNFNSEIKIHFNGTDKKLYVLSAENLFVSEKLF